MRVSKVFSTRNRLLLTLGSLAVSTMSFGTSSAQDVESGPPPATLESCREQPVQLAPFLTPPTGLAARTFAVEVTDQRYAQTPEVLDAMIAVQQAPFTFNERSGFRNEAAERVFREIDLNIDDVGSGSVGAGFTHENDADSNRTLKVLGEELRYITLEGQQSGIEVSKDTDTGELRFDWSNLDARLTWLKRLGVRRISLGSPHGFRFLYDPRSREPLETQVPESTIVSKITGEVVGPTRATYYFDPTAGKDLPYTGNYWSFSPTDWEDWETILAATARHVKELGFPGSRFTLPGEADLCAFRGVWAHHHLDCHHAEENREIALEYAEMYVRAYRAVRRGDPTARITAPNTVNNIEVLPGAMNATSFIRALRKYLDDNRITDVGIDEISIQGYIWDDTTSPQMQTRCCGVLRRPDASVRSLIDTIAEQLALSGFCENARTCDVPIALWGWSSDFAHRNRCHYYYHPERRIAGPLQRAAFVIGSIIREVAPEDGSRNRLTSAAHWPVDTDFGGDSSSALFYTPFPAYLGGFMNGGEFQPAVRRRTIYRMPLFNGFRLLSEMKSDAELHFVRVPSQDATMKEDEDPILRTLATMSDDGKRLRLMLVNNSPAPAVVKPTYTLQGFSGSKARMTVQRIDQEHAFDGELIAPGRSVSVRLDTLGQVIDHEPLTLPPYGIARITLQRR